MGNKSEGGRTRGYRCMTRNIPASTIIDSPGKGKMNRRHTLYRALIVLAVMSCFLHPVFSQEQQNQEEAHTMSRDETTGFPKGTFVGGASDFRDCRSANRLGAIPGYKNGGIGFRVVRDP